jgi:hypothetical protein
MPQTLFNTVDRSECVMSLGRFASLHKPMVVSSQSFGCIFGHQSFRQFQNVAYNWMDGCAHQLVNGDETERTLADLWKTP